MAGYRKNLKKAERHIMTGASYMLPFIITGGMLTALSMMLSGGETPSDGILFVIYRTGQAGMLLYLPVFGAYLAFSIGDRAALAPGFIGSWIAQEKGTGVVGCLAAGFLAGYTIRYLKKIRIKEQYRAFGSVYLYPIGGALFTGGLMLLILGGPLSAFMTFLREQLRTMSLEGKIPLGLLMGAMAGTDFGGPVNKVAYTFAQTQVKELPYLMAGVGAAGAVAPLGLGLASVLFPKLFDPALKVPGRNALIMGCMGLSEGAIVFVPTNPLKIILSSVCGSAAACAASFLFGCENPVPWGGLLVLPVVKHRLFYAAAVLIGTMIEVIMLRLLIKGPSEKKKGDDFELVFEDSIDF
jgi:fructose-specific PTS system IIC-like component